MGPRVGRLILHFFVALQRVYFASCAPRAVLIPFSIFLEIVDRMYVLCVDTRHAGIGTFVMAESCSTRFVKNGSTQSVSAQAQSATRNTFSAKFMIQDIHAINKLEQN